MSESLFEDEGPDLHMCIEELKRELAVRRNVYPAWVRKGRLKPETAAHRVLCIEKTIQLLQRR